MKTATCCACADDDDINYQHFLAEVRKCSEYVFTLKSNQVFTTDATGMFDTYLKAMPERYRKHYNCNCCRRFLDTYGGLCFMGSSGIVVPLMWYFKGRGIFENVVESLYSEVAGSRVTGVFFSKEPVLGTPLTGNWKHLYIVNAKPFNELMSTPFQKMAAIKEEKCMLGRIMNAYTSETLKKALFLLQSGDLFRSEKVESNCGWLLELREQLDEVKNLQEIGNIILYNAANAPAGFCHVRAGVLGTLLDDVVNEVPFHVLKDRFNEKLDPIKYRRPQVAPAAGNIAQAEKMMEPFKNSLLRRYARLEELMPYALWRVKNKLPQCDGIFGHLATKVSDPQEESLPLKHITWSKFCLDILHYCTKIELRVGNHELGYCGFLTAEDYTAPPILQWDEEEYRNPFSWYMYAQGCSSSMFSLEAGYVPVICMLKAPPEWTSLKPGNFGNLVFTILQGAKDKNTDVSMGLFPEIMKSEFHPIRATIEAYSRSKKPSCYESANAFGCNIRTGSVLRCHLEQGFVREYKIDRME